MRFTTLYSVIVMLSTMSKGIFGAAYYGKLIGKINTHAHSFTGNVYAVSEKQVYITDFNYDGTGPKAYFWVGSGSQGPDLASGNRTVDEDGSSNILMGYKNSRVLLTLPNKITAYGYIGIFCVEFKHNFGEVFVPASFGLPEEVKMGSLAGMLSGVKADEVTLKDSANIELKNFNYDGTGKEVHFAVGSDKNAKKGTLVKLLDENGKSSKLEKYSDKTVTLKLPEGHHWIEFKWFTVYSFETDASLGELEIPNDISGKLPVHNPSSEVHKFAAKHFPILTVVIVAVVIVLLLGVGILFYCYSTPAGPQAAGPGAAPGAPATAATEGEKAPSNADQPSAAASP